MATATYMYMYRFLESYDGPVQLHEEQEYNSDFEFSGGGYAVYGDAETLGADAPVVVDAAYYPPILRDPYESSDRAAQNACASHKAFRA